jgi:hypothetical protein
MSVATRQQQPLDLVKLLLGEKVIVKMRGDRVLIGVLNGWIFLYFKMTEFQALSAYGLLDLMN